MDETLAWRVAFAKTYRKKFHLIRGLWDLQKVRTVPFYVFDSMQE